MKQDIDESTLIKYILGEASPGEQQAVDLWIKVNDTNAQTFEHFKFILESSKELAVDSPANEADEWEKFKIKAKALKNSGQVKTITWYNRWPQIAAAVVILMIGAWTSYYIYRQQVNSGTRFVNIKTQNKVLTDTLPDGSIVHLNKNSGISYSGNFKANRKIKLTGEAFFDVKHNALASFTVNTGNLSITDVGTAFNVKSKAGYVEVIVETGIVKVSKNKLSIRLKAQEMTHIKLEDEQLTKETTTDMLYNYYRSNQFVLNKTPLWRMVETLNEVYGAHIKIEGNDLQNIPLTATFKNDSLDKILQVLLLTTPEIHMSKLGNNIILKKE